MPFLPDPLINRPQKIKDNGYKDRTDRYCIRTTREWDNDDNVFQQRKKKASEKGYIGLHTLSGTIRDRIKNAL